MHLIEIKTNENEEPIVSGRELHNKLGIKTTIKTTRQVDSVKKEGFFKRLGKAIKNENEVQKEKVIHTVIVEYDNDKIIGSLEEQFRALLKKVNRHYQRELYKVTRRSDLIKKKKQKLLSINNKIQKMSKQLLADYENTLKEQDELLSKKYNLQYLKNREKRFHLLLALSIVLVILTIILIFLTRQTYKYEDYLIENSKIIKNNLRLKNKIVSMISHDVRAPLKIVSLYIRQLLPLEKDDKKKEMYNSIDYTANSALLLADKILEYLKTEKIEKENREKKQSTVLLHLSDEIDKTLKGFHHLSKTRQTTIKNENKVPKDVIIYFDKQKLQRLYFNLLSNAIKHTENGSIFVTSQYTDLQNGKFKFELTVKDTGNGMNKKQLKGIFEPFKQLNITKAELSAGVGLGLYLCNKIVTEYNGKITIESKPKKGTTVYLYIISKVKH